MAVSSNDEQGQQDEEKVAIENEEGDEGLRQQQPQLQQQQQEDGNHRPGDEDDSLMLIMMQQQQEQYQQQSAGNFEDILREIYWYTIRDSSIARSEELLVGHVVTSLEDEGIYFWRDARFSESQDVALDMAKCARAPYTRKISQESREAASAVALDYDGFVRLVSPCSRHFLRAFTEELIIPDFSTFKADLTYHFYQVSPLKHGQTAQYIPVLRDAEPEYWGLSVCSVDGQRFSVGDTSVKHSLQSVSKPVTYAMGLSKEGHEYVEEWIDVEPAGRPFNTQDLEPDTNRPFNASVNTGAIMAAGILASSFPDDFTWREVVDQVRGTWYDLCGNDQEIGFSQETFESEKATAYNNYAIAYNLKGRKGLPRDVDLHKMLDVYLGCCSIELNTESLSVAAATLANGGVCPITGKEVFPAETVRAVLSETIMCGMYNQAGHFAVEVGLPAKSGVSGALMVIVPNVFGFATFSPRLNGKGNSVRGVEFCKRLVQSYRVHVFEPLRSGNTGAKIDPRRNGWKNERVNISRMAWATQVGDVYATRLRDIFLFALCQTAISSPEGLSERMVDLIRDNYQQIYQGLVDEKLLNGILDAVRENPSELRYLSDLTRGIYVVDAMRSLIMMGIIDIIMVDGAASDTEKSVAVRIATLLGVDKNVALMEISRYEHQIGHRYKEVEYCSMIECVDSDIAATAHHRRSSGSMSSMGGDRIRSPSTTSEGRQRNGPVGEPSTRSRFTALREKKSEQRSNVRQAFDRHTSEDHEEITNLRKEVMMLRRKVGALSMMLNEKHAGSGRASKS